MARYYLQTLRTKEEFVEKKMIHLFNILNVELSKQKQLTNVQSEKDSLTGKTISAKSSSPKW